MKSAASRKATEARLEEIREVAAKTAEVPDGLRTSVRSRQSLEQGSYYGLPALKAPVWTWEVPLYFFVGGAAGMASCIAFVAQLFHANPALVRLSLWTALVGAAICPLLLISDLGRPRRFLNMLRVFKIRSAMSMGAWILVAFSNCVFLAVLSFELHWRGLVIPLSSWLLWLAEAGAALTGLLLASYTGVLIGATAIPVWSVNRKLLPPHFLTSGLGSAAGILELAGFLIPATQFLGFFASGAETMIELMLFARNRSPDAPLHHGRSGRALLIAGLMEGPVALLLRALVGATTEGRFAAAACFLVGALLSRYAWIWAGRSSVDNPRTLFELRKASSTLQ